MIAEITNQASCEEILELSRAKPVFLIKHSTVCPVSASAWREFSDFAEGEERAFFYKVLVRENRETSLYIAEQTGIGHQSPQIILFVKGQAIWNESHWGIKSSHLARELKNSLKEYNS